LDHPSVNGSLPKKHPALLNTILEQHLDVAIAHNPFRFLKMGQVLATCHFTKVRLTTGNDQDQPATIHRITKIWAQYKSNRNIVCVKLIWAVYSEIIILGSKGLTWARTPLE
jgi:hypothetical protein